MNLLIAVGLCITSATAIVLHFKGNPRFSLRDICLSAIAVGVGVSLGAWMGQALFGWDPRFGFFEGAVAGFWMRLLYAALVSA